MQGQNIKEILNLLTLSYTIYLIRYIKTNSKYFFKNVIRKF